jgi:PadR family transcriptional regulator PadR
MPRKRTDTLIRVATVMLAHPKARHYGYDLSKAADIRSGSLYPILARLLEDGWVTDEWEPIAKKPDGSPPRRYYRLTSLGRRELGRMVKP